MNKQALYVLSIYSNINDFLHLVIDKIDSLSLVVEEKLYDMTTNMEEHPYWYEGPCNCLSCRCYDEEEDEECE